MLHRQTFIFLLTLFSNIILGQNLVFNGGAEIINTCDISFSDIHEAKGWNAASSGTSDLFHSCALDKVVSVPINGLGYQEAHTGDGYFGMHAGYGSGFTYYEYVTAELDEPLIEGQVYCVSFYLASGNDTNEVNCITDKFGALFTPSQIFEPNFDKLDENPQIMSTPMEMIDTEGWMYFQDKFTANGGEKYITLGQFNDFQNLNVQVFSSSTPSSFDRLTYYYLDDIRVIEANGSCSSIEPGETSFLELPNVFTPGQSQNQFYRVNSEHLSAFEIFIYNRWGDLVYSSDDPYFEWDGAYKGRELPAGVYFAIAKATGLDGQEIIQKTTISLIR